MFAQASAISFAGSSEPDKISLPKILWETLTHGYGEILKLFTFSPTITPRDTIIAVIHSKGMISTKNFYVINGFRSAKIMRIKRCTNYFT